MCFLINLEHAKPKIADKDIKCWKEVRKIDFDSCEPLLFPQKNHFYRRDKKNPKVELKARGRKIHKGYHSSVLKYDWNSDKLNARFVIPKGSVYYYDPVFKEYVSNRIIFKGYCR